MRANRIGMLATCAILLVALVVLSLVPMLLLGQYDRMACDDYYYSKYTRSAVVQGGSVGDIVSAAADTVVENFNTWQGTYSAVFLFSLQPGIWDRTLYALTPIILIGTLIAGLGVFLHAICRTLLNTKKSVWIIAWMMAILLCLQFPRDANDGFYWYNSAMLYTFFFSLLLLWVGFALHLSLRKQRTGLRLWLSGALLALFTAVIAGANYSTALLFGVILLSWVAWSTWKQRKLLPITLLSLIVFAAGFLINILAPGNAVRQSVFVTMNPVKAVLAAITGTPLRMFGQFLRHPGILGLIVLVWTPFCIVAVRDSNRAFRLPLLTLAISWLILAVQFTPPFYAMGISGPYRLWNIIIFSFYLLLMGNVYYIAGWWKRRFSDQYTKVLNMLLRARRLAVVYLAVVVCASVLLSGFGPAIGVERESATSVRAALALMDEKTRVYAEAFDMQAQAVMDAQAETLSVPAIPEPDSLIPDGDLTDYIGVSEEPALWYGKHLDIAAAAQ